MQKDLEKLKASN